GTRRSGTRAHGAVRRHGQDSLPSRVAVSRTHLGGLAKRRTMPLLALVALTGGVLASSGGGSPVGAAPKSSHAKPVSSKAKGIKGAKVVPPLGAAQKAQKESPAGSDADGGAKR